MQPIRVLFAGAVGAGKTTAVAAASDIPTAKTDVANTEVRKFGKALTTVAMDYGEVILESGQKVLLFGTPGQQRFEFMWEILGQGAAGIILLVDNSRPNPLAELKLYLDAFSAFATRGALVVGVGRTESSPVPTVRQFQDLLMQRGQMVHVLRADVRKKQDVLMLLDALLAQLVVSVE